MENSSGTNTAAPTPQPLGTSITYNSVSGIPVNTSEQIIQAPNSTIRHLVASSGVFLEPSMVGLNSANSGSNGATSSLPRVESTLFRAQQPQQQQMMALNPNPNVWMNTLSKKNSSSLNLPYSQANMASSSKYNSTQIDANLQLQQQLQQLQMKFFKGKNSCPWPPNDLNILTPS